MSLVLERLDTTERLHLVPPKKSVADETRVLLHVLRFISGCVHKGEINKKIKREVESAKRLTVHRRTQGTGFLRIIEPQRTLRWYALKIKKQS